MARIQSCDVLLVVTSPASLASNACTLERRYATALRKVVLPVLVAPVSMQSLPPDLATIHFFDFTVRDVASAGRLFSALRQLPPPGPLPRPLPPPPPPPLSYLNGVAEQINGLVPDLDLQHRIVTALTNGLRSQDSEERATATELLHRFLDHQHRLPDPAERASEALARITQSRPGWQAGPATPPQPVAPPQPAPQPAAPPQPAKRSRVTTVLAWIGGVTVVVIGLGIWSTAGTGDAPVVAAAIVSQGVYNDLVGMGSQPASVACGDLAVQVGATTYCQTPGLSSPGLTVRVTDVQGSTISGWVFE